MSVLTPLRADLRGGNQSDDSFATSKSTKVQSTVLWTLAVERQDIWNRQGVIKSAHSGSGFVGKVWAWVSCWLLGGTSKDRGCPQDVTRGLFVPPCDGGAVSANLNTYVSLWP